MATVRRACFSKDHLPISQFRFAESSPVSKSCRKLMDEVLVTNGQVVAPLCVTVSVALIFQGFINPCSLFLSQFITVFAPQEFCCSFYVDNAIAPWR